MRCMYVTWMIVKSETSNTISLPLHAPFCIEHTGVGDGVIDGTGVWVGVKVGMGLGVMVGASVAVGLGVIVGPRNCPAPQLEMRRPIKTIQI